MLARLQRKRAAEASPDEAVLARIVLQSSSEQRRHNAHETVGLLDGERQLAVLAHAAGIAHDSGDPVGMHRLATLCSSVSPWRLGDDHSAEAIRSTRARNIICSEIVREQAVAATFAGVQQLHTELRRLGDDDVLAVVSRVVADAMRDGRKKHANIADLRRAIEMLDGLDDAGRDILVALCGDTNDRRIDELADAARTLAA